MSRRQLSQYPIVFEQPRRIAPYPFWVEHIPFAFFLVDSLRPRLLVELGVQSGNSFNAFCQAVKTLGHGLAVEATGEPDGIVEALRWSGPSHVFGIQWHPERVVRELAQLNGGTIRIDESPLGGALIEIRFPPT